MNRRLLMISIFAFFLCSCQHKELCFDHTHKVDIEVIFDWTDYPDAAPRTMVLQIFRPDGSHYITEEFVSRDGGRLRIEAGEYKLLFHNGTMSSLVERGDNYYEYELTTKSQSLLSPMGKADMQNVPRPEESSQEPVIDLPENIWGGSLESIQVLRGMKGQSVTLRPVEATSGYSVEIRGVKNMRDDLDVSAALTGMAQSWRISDNSLSDMTATVPFGLSRKDETTLTASFVTFGDAPDHTGKHMLSVYTSQKDYHHFDVTDQIHGAPDRRHVILTLEGLEFKDEEGGMSPDISGWENVDIEIPMQ